MSKLDETLATVKAKVADRDTEQQQPTVSAEAAVTAKQLRDAQQQLKQTSLTVQGLEEQLRSSQQHAQQYQLMADELEKSLAETTQVTPPPPTCTCSSCLLTVDT